MNRASGEPAARAAEKLIVVEVKGPPRTWFSVDWTLAFDKWLSDDPSRTWEHWCNVVSWQDRCALAEHEANIRRARGVPDPDEPEAILPSFVRLSGVPIIDPGPHPQDAHEWDHETQTAGVQPTEPNE